MSKLWRFIFIFLLSACFLSVVAIFSFDNKLHVVFCNVGQGDGILIYRGSTQILVDGGPDRSILSCLGEHMPFWDRKVEGVVLTNTDLDHYGGLVDVFKNFQVDKFFYSGVWKKGEGPVGLKNEVERKGASIFVARAGLEFKFADVSAYSFWPREELLVADFGYTSQEGSVLGSYTSLLPNEYSVVLNLSFGEFDVLLTGDIVPPASDQLALSVAEGRQIQWEVLKVPHHGSKNGLTKKLLAATNPKIAVISVGAKNRYGHPHGEITRLLDKWNVRTLRTDVDGEIEIVSDGKKWWVE